MSFLFVTELRGFSWGSVSFFMGLCEFFMGLCGFSWGSAGFHGALRVFVGLCPKPRKEVPPLTLYYGLLVWLGVLENALHFHWLFLGFAFFGFHAFRGFLENPLGFSCRGTAGCRGRHPLRLRIVVRWES